MLSLASGQNKSKKSQHKQGPREFYSTFIISKTISWTTCTIVYFVYVLFYVSLKNFSLIWRCHNYWWQAAKFSPVFGAQNLWAGSNLYLATPAVTQGLNFSGLIQRTILFNHLKLAWGFGGPILTRILTGVRTIYSLAIIMILSIKWYSSFLSQKYERTNLSVSAANHLPWA